MVKSEPNLVNSKADGDTSQNSISRVCENSELPINAENTKASMEARSHPLLYRATSCRANPPNTGSSRADISSKFGAQQESETIDGAHPLLLLRASKPRSNLQPSTNTISSDMEEHTHPLLLLSTGTSKPSYDSQRSVKTNMESSAGLSGIQKVHPLTFLPGKQHSSKVKSHPLLHRATSLSKTRSKSKSYQRAQLQTAALHTATRTESSTKISDARPRLFITILYGGLGF